VKQDPPWAETDFGLVKWIHQFWIPIGQGFWDEDFNVFRPSFLVFGGSVSRRFNSYQKTCEQWLTQFCLLEELWRKGYFWMFQEHGGEEMQPCVTACSVIVVNVVEIWLS